MKVFGAKPLEDVVRSLKNVVMSELETALSQQVPNVYDHELTTPFKVPLMNLHYMIIQQKFSHIPTSSLEVEIVHFPSPR